jgi:hypothetical protein
MMKKYSDLKPSCSVIIVMEKSGSIGSANARPVVL